MKRLLKRFLMFTAFTVLGLILLLVGVVLWDMPPANVRQYSALRFEWDEFRGNRNTTDAERIAKRQQFAERCLQLAERNPHSTVELCALMMADERAADTAAGKIAGELLLSRIKSLELSKLSKACFGFGMMPRLSRDRAAPALLVRVKQQIDDPAVPGILSNLSTSLGSGSASDANDPGALFTDVADLFVEHWADSPEIDHFCEVLGNGSFSPRWAPRFETHVTRILEVNKNRWVRCAASMALAQIAQAFENRHAEAEERFEKFLAEFDAKPGDRWQNVVEVYRHFAELQLEAMRFAPIGKTAPEINGLDLDGHPMTLSEYRGKVVVLTFWATWCGPCMKLVRHEVELISHYKDQPFAIVGVNADNDVAKAMQAQAEKSMTWRSFRDKQQSGTTISDQWKALFPTVYLIDHQGIVRHRFSGVSNPDPIRQAVETLVAAASNRAT